MQTQTTTLDLSPLRPEEDPLFDLTPSRPGDDSRLSHPQILERILAINPAANMRYLSTFRPDMLVDYLDHLIATSQPRGREARWQRRGDTPAILMREPEE